MKLSELIAAYGDDKVSFQKLDDCAKSMDMNKRGTTVTFVTPEPLTLNGFEKLALIVWMDRKRVAEILATPSYDSRSIGAFDVNSLER